MATEVNPKERYRKGFVLTLTLAYTVAFLAMLSGFFETLLLAAIFSGLTYPLYRWLLQRLGGRRTPASLLTLVITLFAILIPLIFLLALVAEQALAVAQEAKPWIAQQLAQSETEAIGLPEWVPFADRLEPYRNEIMAKLGEFASASGAFLAGILTRLSQGTFVFFFQLFIMLYAMFFFF
jgi:predicted PurR-regulated permease PerM